jgi:hypothetical protein
VETAYYLEKFNEMAGRLDRGLLSKSQMEVKVGVWLRSVALKMQKRYWVNKSPTANPFRESIFFSVWLNDESIREGKLNYNIHALKLRQLTAYSIKSRDFAEAFRARFKPFEKSWPNVDLHFGPQTLMEGWMRIDPENFGNEIVDLAHRFLEIQFIIDDLLEERKK